MRVIQSLGWFLPESNGGTEVYVSSLSAELSSLGVDVTIAAATETSVERSYVLGGNRVFRYPAPPERTLPQLLGEQPHTLFSDFQRWLAGQHATIYHQHSWTYGCGMHHLRAARALGIPTILTVHIAAPVCLRGSMLYEGREPCNGRITRTRCATCWLQGKGIPPVARRLLSSVPPAFGRRARTLGRIGTVLGATDSAQRQLATLLDAAATADRIVTVSQWLYDALLLNGVPRHKLVLCPQGIKQPAAEPQRPPREPGPLRVGYLGRWDPVKGIDVVVRAVLQLPAAVDLELQIRAVEPTDAALRPYMTATRALAESDSRIKMLPPLPSEQVPAFLRQLDVLAVPSQIFEAAPLVVLEAFAAGTPVIGSDLGGIRELIRHGVDGVLVPYGNVPMWSETIRTMAESHESLGHLSSGIRQPRSMTDIAVQMKRLYQELSQQKPAGD